MLGIRIRNQIRIRGARIFLGLPDPDPLVRGTDEEKYFFGILKINEQKKSDPELDTDRIYCQRYGSGDPVSHQNVTDPQH